VLPHLAVTGTLIERLIAQLVIATLAMVVFAVTFRFKEVVNILFNLEGGVNQFDPHV
jgi:hypothetical protein